MTPKPLTPEELAAYAAGEGAWGGSPAEDMRRRLLATIADRDKAIAAWKRATADTERRVDTLDAQLREALRKSRHPEAWLIGVIDRKTGAMVGADIYSEDRPTLMGAVWPVTIEVGYGANFGEAYDELAGRIRSEGWLAWVRPFLGRPLFAPHAEQVAAQKKHAEGQADTYATSERPAPRTLSDLAREGLAAMKRRGLAPFRPVISEAARRKVAEATGSTLEQVDKALAEYNAIVIVTKTTRDDDV